MNRQDNLFENQEPKTRNQEPVECLGKTFDSDEARREHFLGLLREGLEELHAKLGGVPFTTVEDTIDRLKSLEYWPVGDERRIRDLAERMGASVTRPVSFGFDARRATSDALQGRGRLPCLRHRSKRHGRQVAHPEPGENGAPCTAGSKPSVGRTADLDAPKVRPEDEGQGLPESNPAPGDEWFNSGFSGGGKWEKFTGTNWKRNRAGPGVRVGLGLLSSAVAPTRPTGATLRQVRIRRSSRRACRRSPLQGPSGSPAPSPASPRASRSYRAHLPRRKGKPRD